MHQASVMGKVCLSIPESALGRKRWPEFEWIRLEDDIDVVAPLAGALAKASLAIASIRMLPLGYSLANHPALVYHTRSP